MEEKNFDELMNDLEKIVKELESGEASLESSIDKYTEAMKLVKILGEKLNKASELVNKILTENGELNDFVIEDNQ